MGRDSLRDRARVWHFDLGDWARLVRLVITRGLFVINDCTLSLTLTARMVLLVARGMRTLRGPRLARPLAPRPRPLGPEREKFYHFGHFPGLAVFRWNVGGDDLIRGKTMVEEPSWWF